MTEGLSVCLILSDCVCVCEYMYTQSFEKHLGGICTCHGLWKVSVNSTRSLDRYLFLLKTQMNVDYEFGFPTKCKQAEVLLYSRIRAYSFIDRGNLAYVTAVETDP